MLVQVRTSKYKKLTVFLGTPAFMAEEIIVKKKHNFKLMNDELQAADIWSFVKHQLPFHCFVSICISCIYIWLSTDFRWYWKNIF